MSELDNIKSARQQYRAAFMLMATSRDKFNLYKTKDSVLLDIAGLDYEIIVENVHCMTEETIVNNIATHRMQQNNIKSKPRKTAKINVHHVYGASRTVACRVEYRNKLLFSHMENNTPQALLDIARSWAYSNGFTHCNVSYG